MTQDEIVHVPTVANLDQHHHVEQEVMPLNCITTLQGGGDRGVSGSCSGRCLVGSGQGLGRVSVGSGRVVFGSLPGPPRVKKPVVASFFVAWFCGLARAPFKKGSRANRVFLGVALAESRFPLAQLDATVPHAIFVAVLQVWIRLL